MKNTTINLSNKSILVTGAAGFIGSHLIKRLMRETNAAAIIGLDNLNDYYDVRLKKARLKDIETVYQNHTCKVNQWAFYQGSVSDRAFLQTLFNEYKFDLVVHLAAQAGVRYSIDHPDDYMETNVLGFYEMLEMCRRHPVEHLVYASSSSVYGGNQKIPFSVDDQVDTPVSLYAATKKADELFAHVYAKLYGIPLTGLRFFTVYGPAGRPDMFYYAATKKMISGEKIQVYNYGNCKRDFTYIDDIIEGVFRVMQKAPAQGATQDDKPPYAVYNIGGGTPVGLMDFIRELHSALIDAGVLPKDHDLDGQLEYTGMQPGDMEITCADCTPLEKEFGCRPVTGIHEGLQRFARWYKKVCEDEEFY